MNNINKSVLVVLLASAFSVFACPDLQGTYESDVNSTKFYISQAEAGYKIVLDVPGYPLTLRNAHLASKDERENHPYYRLPECTLDITNFGQLLPHSKGAPFYVHFDSRDFQKTFNTDYVLKIDETPNGLMGMNKTSNEIPAKARETLKK